MPKPTQPPEVDHYQVQPRAYHAMIAKLQSLPYQEVAQLLAFVSQHTRIMYPTPTTKPSPELDDQGEDNPPPDAEGLQTKNEED